MAFTKLYSAQLDPKAPRPYESVAFIPDGFNPWAFVFGTLWALYHRLWWAALVIFLVTQGISFAVHHYTHLPMSSRVVIQLGLQVMVGFLGNDLRRHGLERRGWVTSDVVIAPNLLEAARRYYDRYLGQIERSPACVPTPA